MADGVLSQDELSALLAEDESGKGGRSVTDYDLTKATRITGEVLKQLTRIHQAFAQRVGAVVGNALRLGLSASPGGISEQSFAACRTTLTGPLVCQVLALEPSQETALLTVDMGLFGACLDRLLGGPGIAPPVPKPVTDLDREVVEPVLRVVLEAWSQAWQEVLPLGAKVIRHTEDPADLEDLPSAETVIGMDLQIEGDGFIGGRLAIQVPLVALEDALVRLGKPRRFAAPRRPQTEEQRHRIERSLASASLPLVATIGTATLRLSEILAIKVGDVLVLDQGPADPVVGSIEGRPRLLAKPGRVGRRLAVVVQETLPVGGQAEPPAPPPTAPTPPAAKKKDGSHGR